MRKLLLTSGLLLSTGYAAQAADLIIMPEEEPVAVSASPSIYVQLLGGAALGLDVDFFEDGINDESYTMDTGLAAAATLGVVVMDNIAVEGDLYWTDRVFTTEPDYDLSTLSAMINVKAFLPVNEMFTLYGAVGVGYISYGVNPDEGNYNGWGYQLIAGATADLTENIAVVGELRYQSGFGEIPFENDDRYGIEAPTASALVGLKFSF
jgi:opacity protein-like surface antigen